MSSNPLCPLGGGKSLAIGWSGRWKWSSQNWCSLEQIFFCIKCRGWKKCSFYPVNLVQYNRMPRYRHLVLSGSQWVKSDIASIGLSMRWCDVCTVHVLRSCRPECNARRAKYHFILCQNSSECIEKCQWCEDILDWWTPITAVTRAAA